MRIAQLCSVAHQVSAHAQRGIYNITGNICDSLIKKGHEVTLFAAGDAETLAQTISTAPSSANERKLSETEILRENLETASLCFRSANKFDIIHSHFSLLGCHFSPLVETPTLHSLHSPILPDLKLHLEKYRKEKFISFSLAQRKQMPHLNWVANIYHGIDTQLYTFNHEPQDYVLYIGRITAEKGVHHAIAAAKEAGVQLIIAGISYSSEGYWTQHIEPHINGTNVRYIGHADITKKIDIIRNAKAVLFPTLYDEVFGLVMIEAMSCGTPVIAFDNGAVSEVIQDGETGYVVRTEKQMAAAIKKIKKISRDAARERAEKLFSIEKMTRGYERVYQRYVK